MSKVPTVKFNNGQTFPVFGLGTWKVGTPFIFKTSSIFFEYVKNIIDIFVCIDTMD
jgi:diketogulonate reductase-like aldo/keto reductase